MNNTIVPCRSATTRGSRSVGGHTDALPIMPTAMHNVPKSFDGGDIDDEGRWYGQDLSCLECRQTTAMRLSITSTYLLAALHCGECGATFCEYWI